MLGQMNTISIVDDGVLGEKPGFGEAGEFSFTIQAEKVMNHTGLAFETAAENVEKADGVADLVSLSFGGWMNPVDDSNAFVS